MNLFEKRRRSATMTIPSVDPAYKDQLPITNAKKIDLLWMCEKLIIPKVYHGFYESLVSSSNQKEKPVSDFEEEDEEL